MPNQNNRKEFDLFPFCWKCNVCGETFLPHGDFFREEHIFQPFQETTIHTEELNKIPILSRNYDAQEKIKNMFQGEKAAITCSMGGQCPQCNVPFDLKTWIDFELYEKQNRYLKLYVNDYEILDGDNIQIHSIPGFYRGTDIAGGLSKLFLRWFYLKGDIFVICPFIVKEELEYFDNIGIKILKTNSSLGNQKYHANPFKKIITRRHTGFGQDRTTMTESIRKYLEELNGDRSFIEGQPGSGLVFVMTGSLVEVENRPRRKLQGHHQYANYFHAKLYGGLLNGTAEVVITSYNYTVPETLQLESLAFLQISKEDFEYQISKFLNDIHMTLYPADLDAVIRSFVPG